MLSGGTRSLRAAPPVDREVFDEIHPFSLLCAKQGCVECVEARDLLFEYDDHDPCYDNDFIDDELCYLELILELCLELGEDQQDSQYPADEHSLFPQE